MGLLLAVRAAWGQGGALAEVVVTATLRPQPEVTVPANVSVADAVTLQH